MEKEKLYFSLQKPGSRSGCDCPGNSCKWSEEMLHHKHSNSQITDISENELLKYPRTLSSPTVSFTPGACSPLQVQPRISSGSGRFLFPLGRLGNEERRMLNFSERAGGRICSSDLPSPAGAVVAGQGTAWFGFSLEKMCRRELSLKSSD